MSKGLQINKGDGRTPIRDLRVLEALATVPREAFVPEEVRHLSLEDRPLPIGFEQTISQPYIVGLMIELLELNTESRVLEIGTGSGYQAALLSLLTPHVHSVEIIEALAERARETLKTLGYDTVQVHHDDGYHGWFEAAPYDGIVIACAVDEVPPPVWEQLAPGGRIIAPVRGRRKYQDLVVQEKGEGGERMTRTVTGARFVPLTRKQGS